MVLKGSIMIKTAAFVKSTGEYQDSRKQLLCRYIADHPRLEYADCYTEFETLLSDVLHGQIQCIVISDFAGFGQDELETGYYAKIIFPCLNVRLISLKEDFDSDREADMKRLTEYMRKLTDGIHTKEASKRQSDASKRRREQTDVLPNGTAPFGYKFSPDKTCYLADEETADTVRMIFAWARLGVPVKQIAHRMDLIGAMTPGQHRCLVSGKEVKPARWRADTIYKILQQPNYTGDLCLGRIRQSLYRSEKFHRTTPEEWTVHECSHEPLVSREDYQWIQDALRGSAVKNSV